MITAKFILLLHVLCSPLYFACPCFLRSLFFLSFSAFFTYLLLFLICVCLFFLFFHRPFLYSFFVSFSFCPRFCLSLLEQPLFWLQFGLCWLRISAVYDYTKAIHASLRSPCKHRDGVSNCANPDSYVPNPVHFTIHSTPLQSALLSAALNKQLCSALWFLFTFLSLLLTCFLFHFNCASFQAVHVSFSSCFHFLALLFHFL